MSQHHMLQWLHRIHTHCFTSVVNKLRLAMSVKYLHMFTTLSQHYIVDPLLSKQHWVTSTEMVFR